MKDLYTCTALGCDKMYVNSAILRRHVQAFHSNSNKFQCKTCGKALASRQNLKEHSYIHSGEKPYACNQPGCVMSFRQGTHLSSHKKVHQKTNFLLNIKALLEKIAEEASSDEEISNYKEIILPEITSFPGLPVLPSIF